MKKDVYKNGITLNLGKAHTKTSFSTTQNNVLNFSLLCIETHTHPHTHTQTHKIGCWNNQNRSCLRTSKFYQLWKNESSWNNVWFKWNCGRFIKI